MNSRGGHHSQGPSNHYKIGSKLKLGAATSTNFMKNVNQPNSFNMSMLRSVQQNMPNVSPLPSLLTLQSFDLSYFSILFLALLLSLRTLFPSMALIFENLTVWQMPFRWQISHRVLGMHSQHLCYRSSGQFDALYQQLCTYHSRGHLIVTQISLIIGERRQEESEHSV